MLLPDRSALSGVYTNPQAMAAAAAQYDGVGNVYISLNPTLLAPYDLRAGSAVGDSDISRIQWFGLDIDGENFVEQTKAIRAYLQAEHGWPAPVVGVSGTGTWLLWRVDEENTLSDGEAKEVEFFGRSVIVTRQGGRVRVYANVWTHLGGPLSLEGDVLRCAWHGACLEPGTGKAVGGPAPLDSRLMRLPFRIEDGQIFYVYGEERAA